MLNYDHAVSKGKEQEQHTLEVCLISDYTKKNFKNGVSSLEKKGLLFLC